MRKESIIRVLVVVTVLFAFSSTVSSSASTVRGRPLPVLQSVNPDESEHGITAVSIGEAPPGSFEFFDPRTPPGISIPFYGHLYVQFWRGSTPSGILEAGPSGPHGTGFLIPQNYPETPMSDPQVFIQFGKGGPFEMNHAANYLESEESFYRKTGNFPAYDARTLNSNTYIDALLLAYGCQQDQIVAAIRTLSDESHRFPPAAEAGAKIETLLEPLGSPWPMAPTCLILAQDLHA